MVCLRSSYFLLLTLAVGQSPSGDPPTLADLLSSEEYEQYRSRPEYKRRIDVFRKALDRHAAVLRRNVAGKKVEQVPSDMYRLRALSRLAFEEPSREAASSKDRRGKEVKKLEIRVRRLLNTLDDMKTKLPLEHLTGLQETVQDFESLRDQLLGQIFGRGG